MKGKCLWEVYNVSARLLYGACSLDGEYAPRHNRTKNYGSKWSRHKKRVCHRQSWIWQVKSARKHWPKKTRHNCWRPISVGLLFRSVWLQTVFIHAWTRWSNGPLRKQMKPTVPFFIRFWRVNMPAIGRITVVSLPHEQTWLRTNNQLTFANGHLANLWRKWMLMLWLRPTMSIGSSRPRQTAISLLWSRANRVLTTVTTSITCWRVGPSVRWNPWREREPTPWCRHASNTFTCRWWIPMLLALTE